MIKGKTIVGSQSLPNRRSLLIAGTIGSVCAMTGLKALGSRSKRKTSAAPAVSYMTPSPAQTLVGPLDVISRWAIILDYDTGSVLLEKNSDDEIPPSSLTKLMTAYVVFSTITAGRLAIDQSLSVSERAWRMQGSKMFVPLGQQVKVADLIKGMIIQSGNDACIVLAEGIAGSEEQFVVLMNDQSTRLGLRHTKFTNATGWPDPDHHMSARDIAMLASALIRDFPQYYHYFGEKSYSFNNIDQGNRNVLVDKGLADGLKTGHTEAGGFGLCASAFRNGHRIVMVLNGMPTSRDRVGESERLLEWSFDNFEDVRLFAAGEPVEQAPLWLGDKPTVALVSPTDVLVTVPRGWRTNSRFIVTYDAPIKAPVWKGQALGHLQMLRGDVEVASAKLVAGDTIKRMILPLRSLAVLEHMVVGG